MNTASRQGTQTWAIDLFNEPTISSTFAPSGKDLASSTELSEAVAMWDCTASTLPKAQVVAGTLTDAYDVSGQLLTRAQVALRAGATDTRTPRCELPTTDAATPRVEPVGGRRGDDLLRLRVGARRGRQRRAGGH